MKYHNEIKIHIDGSIADHSVRRKVVINDQTIYLQPAIFKLFATLALQLLHSDDPFLYKTDYCICEKIISKYIYRLKQQITEQTNQLTKWSVYINNYYGGYKLDTNRHCITFNKTNLQDFNDSDINKMIEKYLL